MGRVDEWVVGGVVEGAQHPGDVDQRGALEPPFADGPGRLPFEIDDDEVVAGPEHLAEVIVAVDSNALRVELAAQHAPEEAEHPIPRGREFGGVAPERLRKRVASLNQAAKHARRQIAHALVARPLVEGRVGFGRERRVVGFRCQRAVEFGRALAE